MANSLNRWLPAWMATLCTWLIFAAWLAVAISAVVRVVVDLTGPVAGHVEGCK